MGIPMLKIRRSQDRLIFNMGIPILVRLHLYIETAPWSLFYLSHCIAVFNNYVLFDHVILSSLILAVTWCLAVNKSFSEPMCTDFHDTNRLWVNSLAPGRFQWNFRFKLILMIDGWGEVPLRWMSLDHIEKMSALVQVMAWFRQATGY